MKKTRRKEEATSIAWGWVMETLADSKQVDTPLIDDLLSKVPHGSDSLSTTAKERLALRRLDELFSSTSNANSTKRKSASNSIVINGSESAQDVYRRLVSIQTKASSSRASILDSFKLDVHKFTLQKRARLPKCALQQMEEVLTEGGHPCTSVLRGISEDVVKKLDQVRNVIKAQSQELNSLPVPENQDKALQEDIRDRPSSSIRKKGKRVHFAVESRTLHYADDLVNDIEQRTDVGEVHPTHVIASSPVPEIQTEDLRVGHANDAVASYKRTRSEFTEHQHTHIKDSGRMESTEHISDPMSACESSKSPSGNASSFDHNKAMKSAQGILVEGLQDDVDVVDGDVRDSDHITKRIKTSTNEIDHQQPGFVCGTNCVQEEPQDALCQTELEAPRGNVETFGEGTQVQNLQEDVTHVDNDLGKGTQVHQEAPGNALFVDNGHTEVEAESPQGYVNHSGKGAQVQDLVEDVVLVDDDVGDGERGSKRRKLDANLTNRDQPGFIGSNSNIHKKAPLNGPHGYDNQTELQSSRGSVEHSARVSLDSSTNMTDARLALNQDSIGTDWTEDKACLKCNKGGQLLICSASTCFIAVHDSCLGSPVRLDHTSNFYCPFCVYSQANIACQELARKLSDAKQNVRLTKNRLVQFMQNEAST